MTAPPPSSADRLSVLVLSTRFPPDVEGGYEKSCADVVDRLHARGHRVTVVARRGPPGTPPYVYRRMRYRFSGNRRLLITGWLYDVLDLRQVLRIIDYVKPDVVYLWGITGISLRVVAEVTRRFPTVVYIADYWLSMWVSGERLTDGFAHQLKVLAERPITPIPRVSRLIQVIGEWMYRRMYRRWLITSPYAVQFDSDHMAADVRARGVTVARERVIPHGVELWRFPYRAPSERPADKRGTLLFVGRVVASKGIETLIRAMPKILAELPDSGLTVAGPVEAKYSAALSKLAADTGVAHAITMLGAQNQSDLVRLYREHGLLVFPSEWDEPFGIVLVEAMACGLPVLCSAAGGSAEIVDGKTTGLRFRRGDPDDLAKSAVRLLHSHELQERLSRGARQRVEQRYDLDRMVHLVEEDLLAAWRSRTWWTS
jgi:glycogen synthase